MRFFRWGLVGGALLLAACSTDSGGGTNGTRDGGSGGGTGSGGASGSAGTSSSGGMGSECKTTGDCPQTDCFGCPPNVCVNGRCTRMTTGNGGAVGSGGVGGAGGVATACAGSVIVYAGDARCQAWLESHCCVELRSCENDATCKAAVECINRCPSPRGGACLANCAPGTIPPLDDIGTCSKVAPPPTGAQCAWP